MKKICVVFLIAALTAGIAFSQSGLEDPNPEMVGADSAMQALREISVDKFEREGSWLASISPDHGVIGARLFDGAPSMKEMLEGDNADDDTQVLGVKVEFFKRGVNSFFIRPVRPLPVEGVTKTISLWVCGRNLNHELYILVQDYFGNNFEIYMGNLGFSGWKKLTAVIPPSPDGEHGIVQNSAYFGSKPGLRIRGFRVDCNPVLARGSFYMYMDDLRVVTDLYDMEHRDEDDMSDNW